jgi:hypothetical protein
LDIPENAELLQFLNEMLGAERAGDLSVMLISHEENIALATGSGLAD